MSLHLTTQERCAHSRVIVTSKRTHSGTVDTARCKDCGAEMESKNGSWMWTPIEGMPNRKYETDCENVADINSKLCLHTALEKLFRRLIASGKTRLANGIILENDQFQAHDMGDQVTEWSLLCRKLFSDNPPKSAITPEVAELAKLSLPMQNQELDFAAFIRDPGVTWIGPYKCECGFTVVRSSTESGALKLDFAGPYKSFPNFEWKEHKCALDNTSSESSQPKIKRP